MASLEAGFRLIPAVTIYRVFQQTKFIFGWEVASKRFEVGLGGGLRLGGGLPEKGSSSGSTLLLGSSFSVPFGGPSLFVFRASEVGAHGFALSGGARLRGLLLAFLRSPCLGSFSKRGFSGSRVSNVFSRGLVLCRPSAWDCVLGDFLSWDDQRFWGEKR